MQVKILCFLFLSSYLNSFSQSLLKPLDKLNRINCPAFCKFLSEDQIEPFAPVIINPAGPITYYNQYETQNSITLNTIYPSGNQWYKNGVAIPGATGKSLTIQFIGYLNYTDYYTLTHDTRTSNEVAFNYRGCMYSSEYPVTIPWTPWPCISSTINGNYFQLPAPNLGTGTTYSWWLYWPSHGYSTCFSINSLGQLTSNGSWCDDAIYTKSSKDAIETYMFYSFSTNPNCRAIK